MIQMLSALETVGLVDREATLFLNYNGGMAQDVLWTAFSSKLVWIPLGLMFVLYLLTKNKGCQRNTVLIILATALTVLLCDQITSSIIKPLAARLRPSHTPGLMTLLHYVDGYRGGLHGFCSSHAANSFGVAMFVSLCVRRKYISFLLFLFALCVGYSRIYLGVHYLGDVVFGAVLGILIGYLVYLTIKKLLRLMDRTSHRLFHLPRFSVSQLLAFLALLLR